MRKFVFFALVSILSVILLGSCKENEYDEETINKAKATAESYISANFEGVESIDLGEPYTAPMGSLTIDGAVNNSGFSMKFREDIRVAGISTEEGFPEFKDGCQERSCDY
ncbi:DUF1433 domain-containing protein [Terribacillus saccharophilus]|uniref:hypothetical protein n=1 Tax=Terribacillus saccharophilus TaxID=361277 RepID=UPI00298A06B1|nr:hypothetical protein [Terribacillus saccharophilus]MCM3227371.1 DUF1433 domain-containing protein [Terribacillus saccharophilus]